MFYMKHILHGNQMEDEKLAYIAGIIDGEGSIMIQRDCSESFMKQRILRGCNEPHYHAAVRIGMIDRIALDFIVSNIGIGKVVLEKRYHQKNPIYRLQIRKRNDVLKLLKLIMPFLLVKKKQAELAINFMENWVSHNGIRLTPENRAFRENAWLEMRKLNGVISLPATTKPRGRRGRDKSAPFEAIV